MKTLAEFIKEYRKNNKMTQQELADRAGLSKGFISQLENEYRPGKSGKTMTPSLFTLKQLANAMGINSEYLLSIIDEKPNEYEDQNLANLDDMIDVISDILSDDGYLLDENGDQYTITDIKGIPIKTVSLGDLINIYKQSAGKKTLSSKLFLDNFNGPIQKAIQIPLYSPICCGNGGFNDDNIIDYITLPSDMLNPHGDYFAQRAAGDSMTGEGINPGDLLVFEKTGHCDSGQIGCFCIDDNDAVCKKYRMTESNQIMLMPANDKYDPMVIDIENEHFRCIGVLAYSVHSYK